MYLKRSRGGAFLWTPWHEIMFDMFAFMFDMFAFGWYGAAAVVAIARTPGGGSPAGMVCAAAGVCT